MRRSMSAAGAAVVAAGLIAVAGPAAASGAGATAGAVCKPAVKALEELGTTGRTRPHALGTSDRTVGTSNDVPAFWEGTRVFRVPLPTGWAKGSVRAINAKGLMVGVLDRANDQEHVLFSYRKGDRQVTLLTAPARGLYAGIGVNDAGRVAGFDGLTAREWQDGRLVRELPVPPGAQPSTKIQQVTGINRRGDVLGLADAYYSDDNGNEIWETYPVVWPAGGGPAKALATSGVPYIGRSNTLAGIDDRGVVAATDVEGYHGGSHERGFVWKAPYTAAPTALAKLPGRDELEVTGISPTTDRLVGTARTYLEGGQPRPAVATFQAGAGPVRALPVPRRDIDEGAAFAVSDDDRVAGTVSGKPVVWTCASKQAYAP
ncbi:hypothetical protein ACFWAR_15850 [Streptomyces sp. NPDC059917]|uniref:hypothetical protein n=1 Tax=Streptomyces sp. NPDC059917 TaxID=3347002 RepID=UPI00364F1792